MKTLRSLTLWFSAVMFLALGIWPAKASTVLDECWAKSANRIELGECLHNLKEQVDQQLVQALKEADKAQRELDEVLGQRRSTRALEHAQMAFELYRDLECQVLELQAGSGSGSGDFFLACWIDRTRERIAALGEITPEPRGDDLVGSSWLVEDIEGGGVIDFLQSTLVFESDGKVSGMGGCNNFFGSVEIKDGAMKFGPIGASRKACGEAIDNQELRLFQALEKVRSFKLDHGLLSLFNGGGKQVLRLSH